METRHTVMGQFGSEYPAICNHCEVMTAWSHKTWKFFSNFAFFGKTTPYGKVWKFCYESFHRLTDVVVFRFRKFFPTGNRAICTGQKNFGCLSNCRYCADRALNLPEPSPNIWLTMFQISSKSVHFRRSYSRTDEGRSFGPWVFLFEANNYTLLPVLNLIWATVWHTLQESMQNAQILQQKCIVLFVVVMMLSTKMCLIRKAYDGNVILCLVHLLFGDIFWKSVCRTEYQWFARRSC